MMKRIPKRSFLSHSIPTSSWRRGVPRRSYFRPSRARRRHYRLRCLPRTNGPDLSTYAYSRRSWLRSPALAMIPLTPMDMQHCDSTAGFASVGYSRALKESARAVHHARASPPFCSKSCFLAVELLQKTLFCVFFAR